MAEKTEKNKMLGGELYRGSDKELLDERRHAQQLLARYNGVPDDGHDMRTALLRHLLSAVGEGTVVLPTFTCDYGYNISLGRNVFINYHCIFLDCAPIAIGDDVRSALPCNSIRRNIPSMPRCVAPAWNPQARFGSAVMCGSAAGHWCCRGSRSGIAASWVQEAWSSIMCRQIASSWAIRPASCECWCDSRHGEEYVDGKAR